MPKKTEATKDTAHKTKAGAAAKKSLDKMRATAAKTVAKEIEKKAKKSWLQQRRRKRSPRKRTAIRCIP